MARPTLAVTPEKTAACFLIHDRLTFSAVKNTPGNQATQATGKTHCCASRLGQKIAMENDSPILFHTVPGVAPGTAEPIFPTEIIGIVILLGIAALLLISFLSNRHPDRRQHPLRTVSLRSQSKCRWRTESTTRRITGSTAWACTNCAITAYSQDNLPPKDCKRALGPTAL